LLEKNSNQLASISVRLYRCCAADVLALQIIALPLPWSVKRPDHCRTALQRKVQQYRAFLQELLAQTVNSSSPVYFSFL
jgi:hypothetical protein